ncbi:hypothetical protein STENM223S_03681 [Streptomyces tendae]
MTRPLTAAQRRLIEAADPGTGRLKGTEAQLTALVKRGLAFRHPRPPHDHFLTPAGHRAREAGGEPPQKEPENPSPQTPEAPEASSPPASAARPYPAPRERPPACGRSAAPGRACSNCAA